MEENLHKDNLEEFFKNAANNTGDNPAADGWDVPSDQVWENINTAIVPPANPSTPFNWKALGIGLLAVVLLGILYYNYSLNRKIDQLSQTVAQNKTQIEDLKTIEGETKLQDQQTSTQTPESDEAQTGFDADDKQITEKQESGIVDDQTAIRSNGEEIEGLSKRKKTEEFSIIGTSEPGTEITPLEKHQKINNFSQNQQTTSDDDQATESKPKQQKKETAVVESDELNNTVVDLPELNDSIEKEEDLVLAEESNTKPSSIPENDKTKADSTNIIETGASKPDSSAVADNQEIAEQAALKTAEALNIDDQETTPEDSLAIEETPPSIAEEKLPAETSFKKGFYLGAHLAPTYTYRDIQLTGNNPILQRLLDQQEKGDYSYSFGIKTGYNLSKNWSVETGVNFSKATIMSRHRKQIRYRQENEMQVNDGFDSQYNLTLNTSYGDIDTDIAITRASDISIPQNDFIGLRIDSKQDLSFVRIPLVVKYKTAGSKKLHFSARAGIVNSFVVQRDVKIRAVQVDHSGIVLRRKMVERQFKGLEKSSIDLLFGIGLEYDINNKLGIYLEPTITRSISPVYKKGPIKTYPVISTLDIGLLYKF